MAANREACLWLKAGASTGPTRRASVWDESSNRWIKAVGYDGLARMERVPQVGYHGTDITNLRAGKLTNRAVYVLRTDGVEAWIPMTPAGAAESTDYDREKIRRRCNALGWIMSGHCPLRDAATGLGRRHLISTECNDPGARMCGEHEIGVDGDGRPMPPCRHYLAEKKARAAKQLAARDREVEAHKDTEAKQLDAVREGVEANRELAAAIREQVAAMTPAAQEKPRK